MSATTILMEVATPEGLVGREEVVSMVVPSTEGYLGVLANHAPLVTTLGIGVVRYRGAEGREQKMAVSGGFMEVSANRAVLLADTAERGDEINVERAKRALERAERRLEQREPELDVTRAELALKRALSRLQATD